MNLFLLVSLIAQWVLILVLVFLMLGVLRSLGMLTWRLDQLEATTPSRIGRDGLPIGKKAPDFALRNIDGGECSSRDLIGSKVFLIFTQSGCGPCSAIVPELNRLHDQKRIRIVVINNGDLESTRQWASETRARFTILVQEHFNLSKQFQVYATPFAFLLNEQGVIESKGIVSNRQYMEYVLSGVGDHSKSLHRSTGSPSAKRSEVPEFSSSREVSHV